MRPQDLMQVQMEAAKEWGDFWVSWVGPLAGAILAALLWEYGLMPKAPAPRRRKTD